MYIATSKETYFFSKFNKLQSARICRTIQGEHPYAASDCMGALEYSVPKILAKAKEAEGGAQLAATYGLGEIFFRCNMFFCIRSAPNASTKLTLALEFT